MTAPEEIEISCYVSAEVMPAGGRVFNFFTQSNAEGFKLDSIKFSGMLVPFDCQANTCSFVIVGSEQEYSEAAEPEPFYEQGDSLSFFYRLKQINKSTRLVPIPYTESEIDRY